MQVKLHGFDDKHNNYDLQADIAQADFIIGPIPCIKDKKALSLSAPYSSNKYYIKDILSLCSKNQTFIAGGISEEVLSISKTYKVKLIDLLKNEEYLIQNSIPTVEATIELILKNSNKTIHDSNIIVMGYGRIGKRLTSLLSKFGANISIYTINKTEKAMLYVEGYRHIEHDYLKFTLHKTYFLINTIPFTILDDTLLRYVNKECVLIELASAPFGIDITRAKELNLNIIPAPGLPGKKAPMTCAKYIKNSIINILKEG
jgi:dipicolinate synthase subunit A